MAVQLGHSIFENAGTGCLLSKYCNAGLQVNGVGSSFPVLGLFSAKQGCQ